jgi:adenine-specific DNA-methyltransferase
MAIDKSSLIAKINTIEGLTNDERSSLLGLLRSHKKYGLVWEDKPEDVEERLRTELPVLIEDKNKFVPGDNKADAPNHILIEGDNLEALTALAYTHEGKIDVIYIDPPYNTGNKDFVYNDSYVDSEDTYRHSKWLSFMSKRLKLAKQLLSDKGVIFISIDDNEQANLKLLCDELFHNLDYVASIPWRKRTAKSDVPHYFSQDYEWILCYCKNNYNAGIQKETRKYYETPDFPGKPWRVHDLTKQTSADERPNSFFTIVNPKNGDKYPASHLRTWAITEETFHKYYDAERIVFPKDYDFLNISRPVLRYWKEDDEAKAKGRFGYTSVSTDLPKEVGMTQDGTKDLSAIFNGKPFGFPKPISLISYLLKISNPTAQECLILDFFAGSGTTLHATMQLNAEDGGNRKCILVTNNENGICENVTYERNKQVINGYTKPNGEEVEGLHNNKLRYYRTSFVSRSRSPKNMRQLMSLATDMLCIKEDLYNEEKHFGDLPTLPKVMRYFTNGDKSMLVIYYEAVIPEIVAQIEKMTPAEPIKVYVFSPSEDPWEEAFETVNNNVNLCALPAAIYNTYKRILPKHTDGRVAINDVETDQMQQKNATSLFDSFEEGGEQ